MIIRITNCKLGHLGLYSLPGLILAVGVSGCTRGNIHLHFVSEVRPCCYKIIIFTLTFQAITSSASNYVCFRFPSISFGAVNILVKLKTNMTVVMTYVETQTIQKS